jgi:sulfur-oxidizing protein SoxX
MTGRGAGCLFAVSLWLATPGPLFAQTFVADQIVTSLSGHPGNVVRGRALVLSRQEGLCILCHSGPFPEERFQGTLAPDLASSAALLSAAQLRARIVDASRFNPGTIMPSYFRTDGLTRVAPQFAGKTILTAQEIEDVVAFLVSLKQ